MSPHPVTRNRELALKIKLKIKLEIELEIKIKIELKIEKKILRLKNSSLYYIPIVLLSYIVTILSRQYSDNIVIVTILSYMTILDSLPTTTTILLTTTSSKYISPIWIAMISLSV